MSILARNEWKEWQIKVPARPLGLAADGESGFFVACIDHAIYWIQGPDSIKLFAGQHKHKGNVDGDMETEALLNIEDNTGGLLRLSSGALLLAQGTGHNLRLIQDGQVINFSGTYENQGWQDGPRQQALWYYPAQMVELNNSVFVADLENNCIRMIHPEGNVTTIGTRAAGVDDGPFARATFKAPIGICSTPDGKTLYVSDCRSHLVRALDLESQHVRTVAGWRSDEERSVENKNNYVLTHPRDLACTPTGEPIIACYSKECLRTWLPGGSQEMLYTTENGGLSHFCLNYSTGSLALSSSTLTSVVVFSSFFRVRAGADPEDCNLVALIDGESCYETAATCIAKTDLQLHPFIIKLYNLDFSNISNIIGIIHSPINGISTLLSRWIYGEIPPFKDSRYTHCEELCHVSHLSSLISIPVWKLHLELAVSLTYLDAFELVQLLANVWRYCNHSTLLVEMITHRMKLSPNGASSVKHNLDLIIQDAENKDLNGMDAKFRSVVEASALYSPTTPKITTTSLRKGLRELNELRLASSTEQISGGELFTFTIEGYNHDFHVHAWVVYSQWSYFKRMIDFGMEEARTHRAEFPSDFPPTLLSHILQIIYRGDTEYKDILECDASFLVRRGGEFGLINLDGSPVAPFQELHAQCRNQIFSTLLKPSNCIANLKLRLELEPNSLHTESAVTYVARHFKEIKNADKAGLESLPPPTLDRIKLLATKRTKDEK